MSYRFSIFSPCLRFSCSINLLIKMGIPQMLQYATNIVSLIIHHSNKSGIKNQQQSQKIHQGFLPPSSHPLRYEMIGTIDMPIFYHKLGRV